MNRLTSQQICRLSGLFPLTSVVIGGILTLVGQIASIKICKIVGPVTIILGGLLFAFFALCITRSQLRDRSTESTRCEQDVNTLESEEGSNDQFPELGLIYHFEIWIPTEHSGDEMAPPSYEEAVRNEQYI